MLDILYEDNHVIVCYKKAGILSQKDHSNKLDMLTIIKAYIKEKYNKPGDVYLGLVHRLDLNTSGIMVFCKTSKAASRISLDIKENKLNKKYLLVVKTSPKLKQVGILEDYLLKDEKNNKSYVCTKNEGKKAMLEYKVISTYKEYSLVDVNLITGRHHQIRVQFSNIGCPLYGDIKYGGSSNSNFFLALQAYNLEFIHPIKKEKISFTKISKDNIFSKFDILETTF